VIGASNLFDLEIAATALFGFQSETVLATAIGVPVEVPVMLSVMRIVLPPRGWYQRRTLTREGRAEAHG
jgi:ACR3 family arsenite transporter